MRHQTRITIISIAAGVGLAGILQVAALLATQAGFAGLARAIDWPSLLLRGFIPDGATALLAGFPLGAAVYALAANLVLRRKPEGEP